jgi:hypothetical protein
MNVVIILAALMSFSAIARSFEAVVREEKCNIEVTKDIIIPYGYYGITSGSVNIAVAKVDNSNNRRLKAGRILKIKKLDIQNNLILIDDANIANLCVINGFGGCADLYDLESNKFESYSKNTMKLNCQSKPTVDI